MNKEYFNILTEMLYHLDEEKKLIVKLIELHKEEDVGKELEKTPKNIVADVKESNTNSGYCDICRQHFGNIEVHNWVRHSSHRNEKGVILQVEPKNLIPK